MGKGGEADGERKKRRLAKKAARVERISAFLNDVLSATIASLISALILKWLGW